MSWTLWRSSGSVKHFTRPDGDGGIEILSQEDVTPYLEYAKAARLHNDGYTKDRTWRRAAIIPPVLAQKWEQEGWFPHDKAELARRLNSSDYEGLRTADGRLGVTNGVMR